jgi:hypothetical protein
VSDGKLRTVTRKPESNSRTTSLHTLLLAKSDLATTKMESQEFWKGADASKNPAPVKQAHELDYTQRISNCGFRIAELLNLKCAVGGSALGKRGGTGDEEC